jgi:hypothetical protein
MEESTSSFLVTIILASIINLVILYLIIQAAVKSANQEIITTLKQLIKLKTLELENAGIISADINHSAIQSNDLRRQYEEGKITFDEYVLRKEKLDRK